MTTPQKQKFQPNSAVCLIEPAALGLDFILAGPQALQAFELVADGKAAVVTIRGPLCYENFLFDSYSAIKSRVQAACASDAKTIILRIASPGGDVAGAFDCARAIRAACDAAGKRLITYTDENACSAAYAIMCVGDEICASVTGKVGHIGAIAQYQETTEADKAQGIRYHTFSTGALKSTGNPHVNMTDEQAAAIQAQLEQAGEIFFALVNEYRKIPVESIKSLQAGTFLGSAALAPRLIDKVYSWEELLAAVENSATIQAVAPIEAKDQIMKSEDKPEDKKDESKAKAEDKEDKKEDMKSLLAKAAAGGDAKAAKALKAYEEDDDKKEAKAEDDKKDSDKAKAEFPPEKKDDKAADQAAKALAADLAASRAETAALKARIDARDKAEADRERAEYFKSIGASESVIKAFADMPLARAKEILGAVTFKSQSPQLAKQPAQGSGAEHMPGPSANAELNRKMGLYSVETAPIREEAGGLVSYFVNEIKDQ